MATTIELTFQKADSGKYTASFISNGSLAVVQLQRKSKASVKVYANLDGMDPVPVDYRLYGTGDVIFQVELPAGVEVTVESPAEVQTANLLMQ